MIKKRWIVKPWGDEQTITQIAGAINVDPVIANLLVQRGIADYDAARIFFRPSMKDLHDPFLMKDMDAAVERLTIAVDRDEKILVYGDYDVDGTTAVAMMYSFLKKMVSNIGYYIPDRYDEGYGISFKGIDYAAHNGYSLIIALDCGIKAADKIEYAREKGVEFIICDHHLPGDTLPRAAAVLDPKQNECSYPFKELSGCGVGFKLIQAYSLKNNLPLQDNDRFLDLVAVSIASDIVPITGENRVLAHFGIKKINTDPNMGIKALIELAGVDGKELSVNDLVFVIGPRINAAGRIEKGNSAVDLLLSENETEAKEFAGNINSFNTERKEVDKNITEEALRMIETNPEMIGRKTTVLFNPEWHKGVIGIVASRLIENYYRPTVLLTESNGMATGSARSVNGFDLYSAIDACGSLLEGYGGHMHAAGLTMKIENVSAFTEKFEQVVAETVLPDQLIPFIEVDAEIRLKDITPKLYRILKQFQPFGPGNMRPVFATTGVEDIGWSKLVGSGMEHLKLDIREPDNQYRYSGICFNQACSFGLVKSGKPFDVCYVIDENHFQGKTSLQLRIKDIRQ